MTTNESNLCLAAFNSLCEELDKSELVDLAECQYWLFELGYKAALEQTREKQSSRLAHMPATALHKNYKVAA